MIVKPKIRGEIVIKKLSKFGNSTALIIDKPILRLLNMETGSEVEVKIVENKLIVSLAKKGKKKKISKNQKLQKIYEKNIEKYSDDLKKLSEN